MIRYTLLALALIGAAGAAHAQMYQKYELARDPYGRPFVGSPPQPTPGDYTQDLFSAWVDATLERSRPAHAYVERSSERCVSETNLSALAAPKPQPAFHDSRRRRQSLSGSVRPPKVGSWSATPRRSKR